VQKVKELGVSFVHISTYENNQHHVKFEFPKLLNLRKLYSQGIVKAFFIYDGNQIKDYSSDFLS
jgi:hypothetical protein